MPFIVFLFGCGIAISVWEGIGGGRHSGHLFWFIPAFLIVGVFLFQFVGELPQIIKMKRIDRENAEEAEVIRKATEGFRKANLEKERIEKERRDNIKAQDEQVGEYAKKFKDL